MIAPVIKVEASEARKIAKPLTSSGFPNLPIGSPSLKVCSSSGLSLTLDLKFSFQT